MNCYYHYVDRVAVSLCTNCNRGLCLECAADIPNGTACRNRCEAEVRAIKEVMERSKTGYQKAGAIHVRNGILYLLLFAATTVMGLFTLPGGWVMVALGLVFLIGAGFSFSSGRKLQDVK